MGFFVHLLEWAGLGRREQLAIPAHAARPVILRGERCELPATGRLPSGAPPGAPPLERSDAAAREEALYTLADPSRTPDVTLTDQEAWFQSAVRVVRHEVQLPVLPDTAIRVMRQLERPEVNYDRLAEMVETDPILTAELLRTANSVTFRGLQPIVSVATAACRMGARNLRRWLLWFSVHLTVFKRGGTGKIGQRLWKHLLATANAARCLSEVAGGDPDQLFLGGLFHDFGKVIALAAVERVLREDKLRCPPRHEALDAILKERHEKLGAQIVASWGLPQGVAAAAEFHTRPEEADHDEALVKRVALANLVAHADDAGLALGPDEIAVLDAWIGVLPDASQRERYVQLLRKQKVEEEEAFA